MKERILVIEDDEAIVKVLRRGLAYEGYQVDTALDGESGLVLARDHHPDLVVLDWMLPGMDGLEVCQRLRAGGGIPVLMLTAKDTLQDRIMGLDAGADDYLVKPFAFNELLARVRALLRREGLPKSPVLQVGDLTMDVLTRDVRRGERAIELTAKEYAILEYFMRRPNVVVTRTMLGESVWDYEFDGLSNIIDVYVRRLRRKIDTNGQGSLIQTLRGAGYRLRVP